MRLIFFIGILAVLGGHSITEGANFVTAGKDLLGSTLNIGKGVAKAIPSYLDPAQILDLGKQSILGYPVNLLAEAINSVCSAVQSTGYLRSGDKPEESNLAFRLFTPCKNYSYPIESADDMWTNPDFDKNKPVVLFATGWTTNINETDAMTILAKAHACRGDNNFIGVDSSDYVQTLYTWAALNTVQIGTYVGKGLSLLKGKVPSENIHLIGHSLGAHIVSQAGRTYYNLTGEYIGRITGLDPALPCFNEGEELTGLSRGDALYVDIIHTNPGNLGKKDPIGDIDFYPGGLDPLITGCFDISCSHERSWKLYAESVYPGNENVFMSAKCNSQNAVVRGDCGDLNVPMGYPDKPFNTKGNFFLTVNGKSPYGKGQGKPIDPSCGTCPSKR